MFASCISAVVAWSSVVSAEVASDRAPLSPVVPICAKMRMMMGMTRNFSRPAGAEPAVAVETVVFMGISFLDRESRHDDIAPRAKRGRN